jgi:hypothetical protein
MNGNAVFDFLRKHQSCKGTKRKSRTRDIGTQAQRDKAEDFFFVYTLCIFVTLSLSFFVPMCLCTFVPSWAS